MCIGLTQLPAFDPEEFLAVAVGLGGSAANEAQRRTAVGRAYYALFLIARDRIYSDSPPPRATHERVLDEVTPRHNSIGLKLRALNNLRIEADYRMVPSRPDYRDWQINLMAALAIVQDILPTIRSI